MISSIVVILLVLGGGASFVAETSLPGDPLYVVKTSVNEPVMAMITSGGEGHANWEAQLAMRRLTEAEELELRGTLSADMAVKLNAEFATDADAAVTDAQNIGASGASLAMDIRTRLNAVVEQDHDLFVQNNTVKGKAGTSLFSLPQVLEATYQIKSSGNATSSSATAVIHPVPAPIPVKAGATVKVLKK